MNEELNFVSIGDITTDAFIKIKEADIRDNGDNEKPVICFSFADKVPYEFAEIVPAVGNSANAAVSAKRLGLNSAFVSNVGDDENGKECLKTLEKNNIATDYIKVHIDKKTNYHYVLWYKADRTILVNHEQYDYQMPDVGSPKWMYLSSLASNSLPFHKEIAGYLKTHPEIKLAFQPGTFQMQLGYEQLKDIYKSTEVFFCNVQEAKRILGGAGKDVSDVEIKDLLKMMHDLGPKIVVITDGPDGAFTYDGSEMWTIPMYPDPKPPVDRTGAGDSFSSTFVVALGLGKTIPEALMWGPINSMSVVQHIGAQKGLLTREELEKFLTEAPDYYKPTRI
ncbi:carbohydrate kinase family protein [Patescibacteria group bacterium]